MSAAGTAVFLTPEEAALFVQFQKRRAFMEVLEQAGAFSVRSGSVTVHFDPQGMPRDVEVNRHFKVRGFPQVDPGQATADTVAAPRSAA